MAELKCSDTPFGVTEGSEYWHGRAISVDGVDKSLPINESDIAEIVYDYDSGHDWDGDCCAVLELKDGRLVAWESNWGPTGSGFSEDAYGGETDIYFAHKGNLSLLVKAALGDDMRRLAGIPESLWKDD